MGGTCDPAMGQHVPRPKGWRSGSSGGSRRKLGGQREELRLVEALPKNLGKHERAFSRDHLYCSVGVDRMSEWQQGTRRGCSYPEVREVWAPLLSCTKLILSHGQGL